MRTAVWVAAAAVLITGGSAFGQDKKPEVLVKLEGHRGGVTALAFSRDGKLIATGSGNGIVFLWDTKSGEQLAKMNDNGGNTITGVAISADGGHLAASSKGAVASWNISDPKTPKALRNVVSATAARYIGVGSTGDGVAFAYAPAWRNEVNARVEFFPIKAESSGKSVAGPEFFDPRALGCAPDTDSQATAVYGLFGQKDTPAVFLFGLGDVKTVTRGVPPLTKDGPFNIAYSSDGKWLGVCSGKDFVAWKVPGSQLIGGEPAVTGLEATVAAIGRKDLAVTAPPAVEGAKAELLFWKLDTEPKKLMTFKTELVDIRCLAFSPDGNTLAVGGYTDGVVQLLSPGDERKADDKKPN